MKYSSTVAAARVEPELGLGSQSWLALYRYFKAQKPRFAEIVAELGLTEIQGYTMWLLEEPMPMGELARRLDCDNSNITGLVDRLESRGLIERAPSAEDRRVKLLVLTERGQELRQLVVERFATPAPGIASLTNDEQRTLRDLLRKAIAVECGGTGDGPPRRLVD
jgi:MarR family transcriptional regulator, organic hydroperoxide resistance regulator